MDTMKYMSTVLQTAFLQLLLYTDCLMSRDDH